MKIPKYVEELISRRAVHAEKLNSIAYELDLWLDANDIVCDTDCCHTGCSIYADPDSAADIVRQAILAK